MDKFLLAILTFIGGFYTKKYFDNRDLRRKILEPVFDEFEQTIIYLQTQWRTIQLENINHEELQKYCDVYNEGRGSLIKTKTDIIFACKKIGEKKLIPLVEEAFSTLNNAMADYGSFLERRDKAEKDEKQDLINILNTANKNFDNIFPTAMEKVYNRYWILISDTLFIETIKSKLKGYIG